MNVHYIQHVPFEGPGFISTWLKENGHNVTVTRVWEKADFPSMDEWDVLIIMGGPMGVSDGHLYPWLTAEKTFIADAIDANKKIIGICLGAQLLADVIGAEVVPNEAKEIGWFPVKFDKGFSSWLGKEIPDELTVFHWHGDRFGNPPSGRMLASSEACDHQLYTVGENIIGLQFHLEADPGSVASMVKSGADELVRDTWIQDADTISAYTSFEAPNRLMAAILDKMCGVRHDQNHCGQAGS